jgi:putative DNA modification/repair radical SAM protein
MDLRAKLAILADAAKYDASCASSGSKRAGNKKGIGNSDGTGICHSYTPDGRCVSLLKILLTNYCIYDCQYCVNRITSDVPRARFTPQEVVQLTLEFYKRNYIEGLFLSSGIIQSPDYTMEQLVLAAKTLRETHSFGGYIHLKTVPGVSPDLLAAAGRYADRLSVNVELPTQPDLDRLAPEKKMHVIEGSMTELRWRVAQGKEDHRASPKAPPFAPAGQSTQMIVGATPSDDATILTTASRLYHAYSLRRVYYSAFSPIPHRDDRLSTPAPPLLREHRLYQADWLMRFYGFTAGEIVPPDQANLNLSMDPKLSWALHHREFFPVDVNRASRHQLLRIPGLGARNVARIIQLRRLRRIRLADLKKLRVAVNRSKPFVITADYNPDALRLDRNDLAVRVVSPDRQLGLFDAFTEAAATARSGEL